MSEVSRRPDVGALQDEIARFVRAFGLHQPEQTPCGQPIPTSEAHALGELARDAPLTQTELGRRLRLEKSTVSRLIGQLDKRGWIGREPDPTDRRAVRLTLTEAGERAAANLAAAREAKFARLLEGIPETERAGVLRALTILTEASK
jgi:DNA-binding MarR family transcriptional regulator